MESIEPKMTDYPGEHIALKVDNADLGFEEARGVAHPKAARQKRNQAGRARSGRPFFKRMV